MGETLRLILCGAAVGLAVVLPGVSGGTFAIMFGVYDRLLGVITTDVKKILGEWRFWVPLGAGILLGVLLFSRLMDPLFTHFPAPATWFFMGLVAGSLPMLYGSRAGFFGLSAWVWCFVGLSAMVVPVILGTPFAPSLAAGPASFGALSPWLFAKIAASVALGTFAMIIPGLSGSNVLIILGVYLPLLDAVNHLRAALLAPALVGGLVGLFAGAKLVRSLLKRYGAQTYAAILGLVAGSLAAMYPVGLGLGPGRQWIASILCCAGGLVVAAKFGGKEAR
jgi:putative membrane protein